MEFTEEKPVKPGRYWFKEKVHAPRIKAVVWSNGAGEMVASVQCVGGGNAYCLASGLPGWFMGPLDEVKEG